MTSSSIIAASTCIPAPTARASSPSRSSPASSLSATLTRSGTAGWHGQEADHLPADLQCRGEGGPCSATPARPAGCATPATTCATCSANFLDADDDISRVRETYGDHTYRRLAEVKAKYDPDNAFHHNKNIRPE